MPNIRLIVRADDLGYSEAVNYGIEKSIKDGIVHSVGLMPNMPAAAHGLRLLEGTGVCIGQHTNLCLGKPCADPSLIPGLLDENGNLKSSRRYREAWQKGEEIAPLEEFIIEIEAQYQRFLELTGHAPGYFEGHAVMGKNLFRGLETVAARHGLKYNAMAFHGSSSFHGKPIYICPMESMEPDYDPATTLKKGLLSAPEGMPAVFVGHPGYLDDFILNNSTLTVNRTKEVAMFCDPGIRQWLEDQGVELIAYSDIA